MSPERLATMRGLASIKLRHPDSAKDSTPNPPMIGEGFSPEAWVPTYMLGELLAHIDELEARVVTLEAEISEYHWDH